MSLGCFCLPSVVVSAGIVFISAKFWIIASFFFFLFKQTSAVSAYRLLYHCILPAGRISKRDVGGKRDATWQAVEFGGAQLATVLGDTQQSGSVPAAP